MILSEKYFGRALPLNIAKVNEINKNLSEPEPLREIITIVKQKLLTYGI